MNDVRTDTNKVIAIINSCNTLAQYEVARKVASQHFNMYGFNYSNKDYIQSITQCLMTKVNNLYTDFSKKYDGFKITLKEITYE